ncbi:hypothetical protein AOQ73_06090 [Bradyrhizobium pachyrhizi]|uniref:transcriptional regulator n=1 Tax=Bradyrhizobium pachyrhizi TaxID=280333 RepID=UPI000704E702|nr:transcriptional regulator [Bradyrhizobium pachyrhizi]KRQ11643.1 hypothetical protein AOQ73_06090 [Bradyrhizobium pachyrhizi]
MNPGKRVLVPPSQRPKHRAAHPVIGQLFDTIEERPDASLRQVSIKSGIDESTLRKWKRGASTTVANLEACLNVLGLKLIVTTIPQKESGQ